MVRSTIDNRESEELRNASYYCRDRSGKERVPASRLRCDGKGGAAKATGAAAVDGFLANLPRCLVAMEACAGAHYWAREIEKLGHEVRLIPSS
jgi:hypothetical protein